MFLLTTVVAGLCWLAINFSWLKLQLSMVQTSAMVLESEPPDQPGGIVVLKPRRVASRGIHPMLPENLRWAGIWMVVVLCGALWWRLWRQSHSSGPTQSRTGDTLASDRAREEHV